jgi:copper homeostasis protein
MRSEIEQAKAAGASGIAVGILFPDSSVDVKRSRELVELARPMKVTFHRAFDVVRDQRKALEDVILTGADSLLTSGGAPDVLTGAEQICRLQRQAGDRLEIMAGGGLRLTNLAEVVRQSGVSCLHGSLGRPKTASGPAPEPALGPAKQLALEEDLREAIRLLQQECLQPVR